jgi:predicted dithiol-disulfide oxidoreductase (DUF899 family)
LPDPANAFFNRHEASLHEDRAMAAHSLHEVTFPNESRAYREARNELLLAEMELRRQIERVAAQRRSLPLGGEVTEDYAFEEVGPLGGAAATARPVKFSELFGGKTTLIAYSFMYGPEMAEACPSCTSILDGLDGESQHVNQRASFVVIAKSPPARIRDHARARGWTDLRLISSAKNKYNADYRGEDEKADQTPALNVFAKRGGRIFHTWCSELMFAPRDPGQDPRHVDLVWPLWHLLDATPDGRGTDWRPQLKY